MGPNYSGYMEKYFARILKEYKSMKYLEIYIHMQALYMCLGYSSVCAISFVNQIHRFHGDKP